jgi:hypothetical protein
MLCLLLLLTPSLSQLSCPIYSCHEGGYSIGPVCGMLSASNNFVLQVCDSTSAAYCDVSGTITSNYTCGSVPPYSKPTAYPGEYCVQNSDCITQECSDNECVGQVAGSSCVSNSDCNVGLFCGPGFYCTPQLGLGQQCNNDYECGNQMACNRTQFTPGLCIGYFSIPINGTVGTCVDMLTEGVSNLCATGSCTVLRPGYGALGTCTPAFYAPTLNYPRICTSDSQCVGVNSAGATTTGTCSCGMDMNGHAYCDAFSGEPPAITVLAIWQIHTASDLINNCHTQRRFDVFCLQQNLNPAQVQNFVNNRALATDTARYYGNDFCTKAIFNHEFFNIGPANFGCQGYGCGNLADWQSGTCITFAEGINSFSIKPCVNITGSSYCDYTKAENNKWRNVTCGPSPSTLVHYPGEYCSQNADCISEMCTNNVCIGTLQGGSCSSSTQCDIGLFCVSVNYAFTCQPLIGAYQFGCGSDYDCVNYCGCQYLSSGPPGMCVPYFALAAGSTVPCASGGVSFLCATGACYAAGNAAVGTCTVAPTSVTPLGNNCTFSGQCSGTNPQGQSFAGTCTCGYNNFGWSFCQPFVGDAPGKAYVSLLKKYYTQNGPVNACQTTRRFHKDCYEGFSTEMHQIRLNFTMMPYYLYNDQCVKAVYTNEFWNTSENFQPHPKPVKPPFDPNGKVPVIKVSEAMGLVAALVGVLIA